MNVVNFLTATGLFIGQSPAFFALMRDLAATRIKPDARTDEG